MGELMLQEPSMFQLEMISKIRTRCQYIPNLAGVVVTLI